MSRPKPKVFVTRNIPEPGLSILHQNCNVHIHSGMVCTEARINEENEGI